MNTYTLTILYTEPTFPGFPDCPDRVARTTTCTAVARTFAEATISARAAFAQLNPQATISRITA